MPPHLEYVSKGLANIRQRLLRRDCALPAITRRDNYRADRTAIAGSTFREKAFSSYSAGRPRLGCARGQPRTGPDRLRARRPAARRAGTLTPGASRSSRAACHLSPGPGGPAFDRPGPRLHALIPTSGDHPDPVQVFGLTYAYVRLSRQNIRRSVSSAVAIRGLPPSRRLGRSGSQ